MRIEEGEAIQMPLSCIFSLKKKTQTDLMDYSIQHLYSNLKQLNLNKHAKLYLYGKNINEHPSECYRIDIGFAGI